MRITRQALAGIAALALALTLAGCGSEPDYTASSTGDDTSVAGYDTSLPDTSLPDTSLPEDSYAGFDTGETAYLVNLDLHGVEYSSEDAAVEVAHAICEVLEVDPDVAAVGVAVHDSGGYSWTDAGTIVGSAVGGVCPEFSYLVP